MTNQFTKTEPMLKTLETIKKTLNPNNKSTFLSFVLSLLAAIALCNLIPNSAFAAEAITASAKIYPYEVETSQIAQIEVQVQIPPGFKAYEDKFKITFVNHPEFKLNTLKITPTHEIFDKFTKKNKSVATDKATLNTYVEIPVLQELGEQTYQLLISYQMCSEAFCLFPSTVKTDLHLKAITKTNESKNTNTNENTTSFFKLSFKQVFDKGLLWTFVFVFIFGFLTSFTPCVYPMIPITLAILGREAHARTKLQNFLVSFTYVTGIGITFSGLGILAASSGVLFGSFMSSPWVLGSVSLVFLAMSLSMFGLYEIEAPQFLRDGVLSHLKLHGYAGALASGMLAGFVASPCVGPVLVGILTFVAQSKNIWLGFWLLFTYSLGMGLIFLILGLSSGLTKKLPKSGPWMSRVKFVFAITMLLASAYYAKLLYDIETTAGKTQVSAQSDTNDILSSAKKLDWNNYSEDVLQQAKQNHKPVLIDFRADWCAACLEMEEKTFSTAEFSKWSEQFVLVRVDATQSTPEVDTLREKYQLVGLPTLVFIDSSGHWRQDLSITEFVTFAELERRTANLDKK